MATEEKLFKTYEKELKEFEEWILQNPRLPKKINKLLLLRFLKVYDFDVEAAKKLYITFLETRKKHSYLFQNRDVLADDMQTVMSIFQLVGLKKLTKDSNKVTVFKLTTPDAKLFSYVDLVRLCIAMLDCRFVYCDENELINGEVSIIDVTNFTFGHFRKILTNISTMKAYLAYAQEAAPIKITQSHFINCSSILSKMMAILKPFMRTEVWESMKFHSSLESLQEYIPKDILPVDYGGNGESLDESFVRIKKMFEDCREYLLCDDNWKIED